MEFCLNSTFQTYEHFQRALELYSQKNNVVFVIDSTKTIQWANQKLPDGATPYNECLKYKNITLKCKHGPGRRSTSTGVRPMQRSYKLNCSAKIQVIAEQGTPQVLRISRFQENHQNHPSTSDFVKFIPERKRLDAAEQDEAQELLDVRGKLMAITKHVRQKTGKACTARDLSNQKQRKKKERMKGKTDTEDVLSELEKMKSDMPGSDFIIGFKGSDNDKDMEDVDSPDTDERENPQKKEIAYIYFQTSKMRDIVNKFPEVIGADTTYNVNKNNMHLIVMKCIDNHGNGRTVGYSFVARETKDMHAASLSHFKQLNSEAAEKCKTFIVDKDYKEINPIHAVLPHVSVHLCHVHVMRTFKSQLKEHNVKNRKEATDILRKMCESGSREEFLSHYEKLQKVCNQSFMEYFNRNWKDIDEAWVLYVRNCSLTLGIRSTNHIESHNGKVKAVCDRCCSMGDCVRGLLLLEQNTDFESSYKDFKELSTRAYVTTCDDPEVTEIMGTFARWPAKMLYEEWRLSHDEAGEISDGEDLDSCHCNFFLKFGMNHCRHIFNRRRAQGQPILLAESVPSRWLKPTHNEPEAESTSEVASAGILVQVPPSPTKPAPKCKSERYKVCLEICKEIASLISITGGTQFTKGVTALKELRAIFRRGGDATVIPSELELQSQRDHSLNGMSTPPPSQAVSQRVAPHIQAVSQAVAPESQGHTNDCEEDERRPSSSNGGCSDSSRNGDEAENDNSVAAQCSKCKQPLQKYATKSDTNNNRNRYHLACPKRCAGSFRWYKCPTCESTHVRVGHACVQTAIGGSPLSSHISDASSLSPDPHHLDDDDGAISIPRARGSDDVTFDLGIDDLLETDEWNEEWTMESVVQGMTLDEVVDNLDDLARLENTMPVSGAASNIHASQSCPIGSKTSSLSPDGMKGSVQLPPAQRVRGKPRRDLNTNCAKGSIPPQLIGVFNRGLQIDKNHVTRDPTNTSVWLVKPQSGGTKPYIVKRRAPFCQRDACADIAAPCMHRYICDCLHKCNPCKHIVKVHSLDVPNEVTTPDFGGTTSQDQSDGQKSTYQQMKDQLQLPPPQKVLGRPNTFKTKSFRKTKKDLKDAQGSDLGEPLPQEGNTSPILGSQSKFRKVKKPGRPTCPICVASGPPTHESAHKCALCNVPVHSFGCSTNVEGGEEGCGGTDRICWPCSEKRNSKNLTSCGNEDSFIIKDAKRNVTLRKKPGNHVSPSLSCTTTGNSGMETTNVSDDEGIRDLFLKRLPWMASGNFPPVSMTAAYECEGRRLIHLDFLSMKDHQWLYSPIIECFLDIMLQEAAKKHAEFFVMSPTALQFMSMGVDSYLTAVLSSPSICKDVWCIPSNVEANHFVLFLVIIKEKRIIILNSSESGKTVPQKVHEELQVLMFLLDQSHKNCTGSHILWDEWTIHVPMDVPRQLNGSDCGVIVCSWLFSLCNSVTLPIDLNKRTTNVRRWLSNVIMDKSTRVADVTSTLTAEEADEVTHRVFQEHNDAVADGSLKIDKPWLQISPIIHFEAPGDANCTRAYVGQLLNSDSIAENAQAEKCAAPHGCCIPKEDMYLCELCRHWLHLNCIRDQRKAPKSDEAYLCPVHFSRTRTRGVNKPLKLRVSIG